MTAKRQADGSTLYRGQAIRQDTTTPHGRLGRYTWNGRAFAQLGHAKSAIDQHAQESTQ